MRFYPHSVSDSALLAHDLAREVRLIAGVDEVGAGGCWAGPIMAAGVLFDLERLDSGAGRDMLNEVNDSKRLAPAKGPKTYGNANRLIMRRRSAISPSAGHSAAHSWRTSRDCA